MATDWYYKEGEQEVGPHTFHDLVEMVREEKLTADVLVRPDYLKEWQRAETIVGLFHMAQREPDSFTPITTNDTAHEDEISDAEALESSVSEEPASKAEVEKPGWLKRLLSIRNSKIPPVPIDPNSKNAVELSQPVTVESGLETSAESAGVELERDHSSVETEEVEADDEASTLVGEGVIAGAYSDETWSTAINAAVDQIDARAPKPEEEPEPKQIVLPQSIPFIRSPTFHKSLKIFGTLGGACLVFYFIVDWMGQGTLYFPMIGVCSPLMFLVYSAVAFLGMMAAASLLLFISSSYLRRGFKLGAVLFTTSMTVYYLLNWSEDNFVLFPTRTTKPIEAKLVFPYIGECSTFTYWMYFVDVVVFVAVFTFLVAWWLEAHAEDV